MCNQRVDRYPLSVVWPLADDLIQVMTPACQHIAVAGSLRRRETTVKDIEIVAEPQQQPIRDLFGQVIDHISLLDDCLRLLVDTGRLVRLDKDGPRYKTFVVLPLEIKLDLFIVLPPSQFGLALVIRTGPAAFSKRVVTQKNKGGLLPSHLRVAHLAIWNGDELIPTPGENEVFTILGSDWIPPTKRA